MLVQGINPTGLEKIHYDNHDWDAMIVLDACRYDAMRAVIDDTDIKDYMRRDTFKLYPVNSQATHTPEWYRTHWANSSHKDIQLVSANPQPWQKHARNVYKRFYKAHKAWRSNDIDPSYTLWYAQEVYTEGKKLIVHLIPPHLPYIGKEGSAFMKKHTTDDKGRNFGDSVYKQVEDYGRKHGFMQLWGYYVESIYDTLKIVFNSGVLDTFNNVMITADHAELIGENMRYHHPPRPDTEEERLTLQVVPCLEL